MDYSVSSVVGSETQEAAVAMYSWQFSGQPDWLITCNCGYLRVTLFIFGMGSGADRVLPFSDKPVCFCRSS